MQQEINAREKSPSDINDAREKQGSAEIDARQKVSGAPVCSGPDCTTLLRASGGRGRPPVYCSRSCSSRAYRLERDRRQQEAVERALASARVENLSNGEAGPGELRQLARGVERLVAQFLEQLGEARLVTVESGEDPGVRLALKRLEGGIDDAARQIIHAARALCVEELIEAGPAAADAARIPAGRDPDSPRVENGATLEAAAPIGAEVEKGVGRPSPERGEEVAPTPDWAKQEAASYSTRAEILPAPRPALMEDAEPAGQEYSTRVEYVEALQRLESTRAENLSGGEPLRLDLVAPSQRGLGQPTTRTPLDHLGPDWSLAGWAGIPTLFLVLHQGHAVGWVEHGVTDVDSWIAVAGDGYLVDEDSGQPLWHASPHRAARTVQLALQQTAH